MLDILMNTAKEINPSVYSSACWALDWNQMDEAEVIQYLVNSMMV